MSAHLDWSNSELMGLFERVTSKTIQTRQCHRQTLTLVHKTLPQLILEIMRLRAVIRDFYRPNSLELVEVDTDLFRKLDQTTETPMNQRYALADANGRWLMMLYPTIKTTASDNDRMEFHSTEMAEIAALLWKTCARAVGDDVLPEMVTL